MVWGQGKGVALSSDTQHIVAPERTDERTGTVYLNTWLVCVAYSVKKKVLE